jgi:hypothetical protein
VVDKAIVIENKIKEMEKDGKRKVSFHEQPSGSNVRPRFSQPNQFFKSLQMNRPQMPVQVRCPQFLTQRPNFQAPQQKSQVFGSEVLKDVEKQVQMVRKSLKVAQSQQKSYVDKRRRDLSFEIRDFVYLNVSPMRGTRRFTVKGKLATRYVGPFKIIDRKGEVAYLLELSPLLSEVHDVFHVSQLKKCLRVPEEQLPMEYLDFGGNLTYSERPIKILDRAE